MTERLVLSEQEKAELIADAREIQKQREAALVRPIPPDQQVPADQSFREKVALAIIREPEGDVGSALAKIAVDWEVYRQVTDHPEWDAEMDRLTHRLVVQPRMAAVKGAVVGQAIAAGSGYHLKMLADTKPKEKLSDEDSAFLESMTGAPRAVLKKEALRLRDEVKRLLEVLDGGERPAAAATDEIVRSVTQRKLAPKKGKSKT